MEEWLMRKHGMSLEEAKGNGKRRKKKAPEMQMALF
jgi:hypothetical protein